MTITAMSLLRDAIATVAGQRTSGNGAVSPADIDALLHAAAAVLAQPPECRSSSRPRRRDTDLDPRVPQIVCHDERAGGRQVAAQGEHAEDAPAAAEIGWEDLEPGVIVRYEHASRARRLAGKRPLVRRGRVRNVYPPSEVRHGQISITVLNKDGTPNKRLPVHSLYGLDFVAGIEHPEPVPAGTGTTRTGGKPT